MRERQASQRLVTRKVAATAAVALAMVLHVAPANAQDPRPPQAEGSIPAQAIATGSRASVDLNAYFSDPNGDALAYAATVSNVAVATVSVSGTVLTIVAAGPGTAGSLSDDQGRFEMTAHPVPPWDPPHSCATCPSPSPVSLAETPHIRNPTRSNNGFAGDFFLGPLARRRVGRAYSAFSGLS